MLWYGFIRLRYFNYLMEGMHFAQSVYDSLAASHRVAYACRAACGMPSLIGTGLLGRGGFGVVAGIATAFGSECYAVKESNINMI